MTSVLRLGLCAVICVGALHTVRPETGEPGPGAEVSAEAREPGSDTTMATRPRTPRVLPEPPACEPLRLEFGTGSAPYQVTHWSHGSVTRLQHSGRFPTLHIDENEGSGARHAWTGAGLVVDVSHGDGRGRSIAGCSRVRVTLRLEGSLLDAGPGRTALKLEAEHSEVTEFPIATHAVGATPAGAIVVEIPIAHVAGRRRAVGRRAPNLDAITKIVTATLGGPNGATGSISLESLAIQ